MAKVGKVVVKIVKKIIFAFCLIYGFDLLVTGLNIFIPINIFTVSVVGSLGISGLISLIGVFFVLK